MADTDYVLFHRGLQFLNQADQYVSFGKTRQLDSQTHFVPMYWRGPIDQEVKTKYRKIFFDTDRISCANLYFQDDQDWVLETEFLKSQDKELFYFLQNLEEFLIERISISSLVWFRHRITRAQVEDAFRPIVIVSRRTHGPIVRWHVPCEEGVPKIEVVNQFRRKMYPHQFHPGMDIEVRFQLAGIQFNQNYCSAVINVHAIRMFSHRSQKNQEGPFHFRSTITPSPAEPILPEIHLDDELTEEQQTPQPQPEEQQPEEQQPEEVKPEEVKPEEQQPEEVKAEEVKTEEVKTEEVKTEEEEEEEGNRVEPELRLEEERSETSSIRKRKEKIVKRIMKTSKGERIWFIKK